ncbi:MAG: thiamine pyrophosphate-dependent dehydrogenase E1 component subunit alpha [Desulfarculaceae bacterium]|nr:thiamine pyrophosphate-dependent dehydrogenase E1 component subunit alpha [Desulfarculaceae bacterium]MCF8072951.1 thiamine pyrophosphate-dependent dehydrogenase E1 component subunit alpha [Desulfarculaceae bacterium]MCF8115494.1 thiamine pyrophosphate-dependent dehydrogenase E1 component subunit alpha [Desulfarculaceae bacterium]
MNSNFSQLIKDGRYIGMSLDGVDGDTVWQLYVFMQRLRLLENAIAALYSEQQMRCPVHFCDGQEAISAGLALAIRDSDHLFSHHRTHGFYLAKCREFKPLIDEIYGRISGASGGVAGSQDISYCEMNFHGGAILAGSIGIAAGVARAMQIKNIPALAFAGFGDGAVDEGVFWETVNYAALQKLPLVLVCENNGYSAFSPQNKRQAVMDISAKVRAFGMQAHSFFGNDAVESHRVISQAVGAVRRGEGPVFLEGHTFRWSGHVGPEGDDQYQYRSMQELAFWKDNCPIKLLEEKMLEEGLVKQQAIDDLVRQIGQELDQAFAEAKQSPFPEPVDWHAMNYATQTPKADELLAEEKSSGFDQNQDLAIPGPY